MFIRNDAADTPANTRWRQLEKTGLVVIVGVALFIVLKDAVTLSDTLAKEQKVSGLEASMWTETRMVDLNDGQLRGFRSFLPALIIAAILFVWLKSKWITYSGSKDYRSKLQFYLLSGLACCVYLHGPGLLFLLLWAVANYKAGELWRGTRFFAIGVWAGNLTFLIFAEYTHGLKFAWFGLGVLVRGRKDLIKPEMAWHRSSNLCLLKVISYLMDSHWRALHTPTLPKEVLSPSEAHAALQ